MTSWRRNERDSLERSSLACSSILASEGSCLSPKPWQVSYAQAMNVLKCKCSPSREYRTISTRETNVSIHTKGNSKSKASSRTEYQSLISSNSVKNILLNVGSQRSYMRRTINEKVHNPNNAAILIQSVFRRFYVFRKFQKEETNRIEGRHIIIRDCLERKGCWGDYLPSNSSYYIRYYGVVTKEIKELVNIMRDSFSSPHIIETIFSIFFTCLQNPNPNCDFINMEDAALLLIDIIQLPISRKELIGDGGLLWLLPRTGIIYMNDLYRWYLLFCQTHNIERKAWLEGIKSFFAPPLPDRFLNAFIKYRSSLFDLVFNLKRYDMVHKPRFRCRCCGLTTTKPLELAKHIVQYHKE